MKLGFVFRSLIDRLFRRKNTVPQRHLAKDELGKAGEKLAVQFLRANGYHIVARNVRFSIGEIDIVARHQKTLAFIEVKTRRSAQYCHPIEAVGTKKRQKIKQMAIRYYRNKKYAAKGFSMRFDIITLIWPGGEQPKIEHFVDAFR